MVTALHQAGVPADRLAVALPRSKFLPVDGELTDVELAEAIVAAHPAETNRLGRWFLDAPLHDSGRTWVLSKMWGRTTEPALEKLVDVAPTPGFAFEPGPVQE